MKTWAPLIHENYPGNINIHVKIDVGDVEKGFKESYLVREDTFTAPEESYFQAEPYAVVAQFDNSGNLEIWMPNAGPHLKSKPLANVLKMPLNKVRVRKITIGGAFGGRSEISPADVICALLARKAHRPVKIVYTREENTDRTRQAHAMKVMDQDGRGPRRPGEGPGHHLLHGWRRLLEHGAYRGERALPLHGTGLSHGERALQRVPRLYQ